jgi:hypothetical protein
MKKVALTLTTLVFLLGAAFIYYFGPGGDGIIGRLTLSDGTEFRVVQRYNNSPVEPYTVDFYFKLPGSPWGWCYIEHEDTRWSSANIIPVPSRHSIQIYRGSTLRAEYFTDRKTFALYAEYQRELPAPQETRIPPS